MNSIIFIALFDVIVLMFVFFKKKNDHLLYDITPEDQYSDAINEFDKNMKAIENIDVSNYKLDSSHVYNNN